MSRLCTFPDVVRWRCCRHAPSNCMTFSRGFRARTVATAAVCAFSVASQASDRLGLPAQFAKYREWTQLLESPYQVPMELWVRCMAPTPADWEAAQKKYGPHTRRFVRVYGNAAASKAVLSEPRQPFPPDSIVAKEKLSGSPDGAAEGVAFMVKHAPPAFPDTGGWEFLYFPAAADTRRTHADCASCHRAAASSDYVFGQYPR